MLGRHRTNRRQYRTVLPFVIIPAVTIAISQFVRSPERTPYRGVVLRSIAPPPTPDSIPIIPVRKAIPPEFIPYKGLIYRSTVISSIVISTGNITIVLQKDSGSGFTDIAGTTRNMDISSGFGNISLGIITDVNATDKLRIRWIKNDGASTYTILAYNLSLNIKYLAI